MKKYISYWQGFEKCPEKSLDQFRFANDQGLSTVQLRLILVHHTDNYKSELI